MRRYGSDCEPPSPRSRAATGVTGRLERRDGSVVELVTVPLPDGATLVTFLDVTDTINVERALRERNEALEAADALKVDFRPPRLLRVAVAAHQHYRLCTFPGRAIDRPADNKQREYLGYINTRPTHCLHHQ